MINTKQPVFVSVETSVFSGATLLAFLLGAHPQIATVGEMDGLIPSEDPHEYLCSCGQRIEACGFWQSIKSAMRDRGFEFDVARFDMRFIFEGPKVMRYLRHGSFRNRTLDSARDAILCTWPAERRRWKALVARNQAFVESVLEVTGKGLFVDTSKDRLRVKALRKFSALDVRAIHLIRDVRGVVASQLRRGRTRDVQEAARQWVKLNQKIRMTLQSLPAETVMSLLYEDLCQDVQGTVEELYRFCGVDSSFKVANFRAVPHHIIGNKMRLSPTWQIKLDERWKSLLTEDQLKEIDQVAGGLGRRYGYS